MRAVSSAGKGGGGATVRFRWGGENRLDLSPTPEDILDGLVAEPLVEAGENFWFHQL
jgi:hypothetical protein